jgi:hypothetical protein
MLMVELQAINLAFGCDDQDTPLGLIDISTALASFEDADRWR